MTWQVVADVAELSNDPQALPIEIGGRRIALVRLGDEVFAIDNICTHAFALLSDGWIENGMIECPMHQGLFDLATGACRGGPVTEPISTYAVQISEGKVMVDLDVSRLCEDKQTNSDRPLSLG
jgi:nitrite reductase/ring-hydroxylating ferredoxin subunit